MIAIPLPFLLAATLLAAPEPEAPAAAQAQAEQEPAAPKTAESDAYRYADELYKRREQAGAPQTARRLLEKAISIAPLDSGLLWRYGRARIVTGERTRGWGRNEHFVAAEQSLQAAIDIDPDLGEARYWLAMARFRRGRYKEALEAVQAALAQRPDDARLHHLAGDIRWQAPRVAGGDRQAAVLEYEKALSLSGRMAENYLSLAEAYTELGRPAEAAGLVDRLEKMHEPGAASLAAEEKERLDKLRRRLAR